MNKKIGREIKFRGKRVDNGKWVYGYYEETVYNENHFYWINELNEDFHEVDPETVGQYTGFKDRNGIEIYEGDILRNVDNLFVDKLPCRVVWNDYYGAWVWQDYFVISHLYQSFASDCEVIGNIHDNPELIGVKNEKS